MDKLETNSGINGNVTKYSLSMNHLGLNLLYLIILNFRCEHVLFYLISTDVDNINQMVTVYVFYLT